MNVIILKEKYNIPINENLTIFKIDYNYENLTIPIIEYKLYYKDKLLNLSYCDNISFIINLDNYNISLEDSNSFENLLKLTENAKIISSKEFTLEVTDTKENKDENKNLSSIDLGECEYKLKEKYNIPMNESLLIYKIDLVTNYATPKIEYLVYSQNKTQLDLKYCNDVKIYINSPIDTQKLDDFELIKDLNNNGIDLYNQNDSFFNDRCNNKNINDSDIPLSLRRELFFQNNSLCEKNCQYEGIDLNNNKVKCNCDVKVETNFTVNEEKSINNFGDNVIGSINFDIIYCYKKLLNFNNYITNIGFYFGSGMLLSNICLNFINFFYSIKKIFFLLENLVITSNPIKNNNNITTIINDEKSSTRKLNNSPDKKIQNLINENKLDDKISLICYIIISI